MKKRLRIVQVGVVALLLLASMMFGVVTASADVGIDPIPSSARNGYLKVDEFSFSPGDSGTYNMAEIKSAFNSAYINAWKYYDDDEYLYLHFDTNDFQLNGKAAHVDKIEAITSGADIDGTRKVILADMENRADKHYKYLFTYHPKEEHVDSIIMHVSLSDGTSTYFNVEVSQELDKTIEIVRDIWRRSGF